MKFTKVALIGAGAVGAYFIYGFTNLEELSFCVVAEGERAECLRNEGVVINEKTYYPEIRSPQEAKGVDLILVCTKHHHLPSVLDAIETMTDDHTTVQYLIAHHHTYDDIDGIDYQILVEADFLVNIMEDNLSDKAALSAYQNIFRTACGKKICREMFALKEE